MSMQQILMNIFTKFGAINVVYVLFDCKKNRKSGTSVERPIRGTPDTIFSQLLDVTNFFYPM